jgi:DNA polymerase elongation subunit (family B)
MNYDDMQRTVVDYLYKNQAWNRAVSLDIEADLDTLGDSKKLILSLSVAVRNGDRIDVKNFILDEETEEGETTVIGQFGTYCQERRPLLVTGFGITDFDLPVLLLKMRQLDVRFKKERAYLPGYWAFRDTLRRAYFLDMVDPVRFEIGRTDNTSPKFVNLETVISHKRFQHLPFRNTKHIVSDLEERLKLNKWEAIHHLWKSRNESDAFKQYIEGDVHDTLLLAEELFLPKA